MKIEGVFHKCGKENQCEKQSDFLQIPVQSEALKQQSGLPAAGDRFYPRIYFFYIVRFHYYRCLLFDAV
ncbi:hypothetical protein H8B09_20045 [Paenibacillus sp. PR3]|uniref:Uncharacterized protein n=1 Tax=Paenibacillus terricola TaxID=2763503 RepID=A0ABR8MYP2_9BACL|nr:hypothetical protein [Paenibacillus terricola]MBD3921069.1 hypothetical protein [Paenibacillus terricola]